MKLTLRYKSIDNVCEVLYNKIVRQYPKIHLLKGFDIKAFLSQETIIEPILFLNDMSLDELIDELLFRYQTLCSVDGIGDIITSYSVMTYTPKGELLRSSYELSFFQKMQKEKLDMVEYYIDKRYSNSFLRYDFWFPKAQVYVEIAPRYFLCDEYKEKIDLKKELFEPIVVITDQDRDNTIQKLKEFYYG